MEKFKNHFIKRSASAEEALFRLNTLEQDKVLFITDEDQILYGSLSDGDIRRGLLKGFSISENVMKFAERKTEILHFKKHTIDEMLELKQKGIRLIPIVDQSKKIHDIVDLFLTKANLPIDAVIMAGGRGKRLMPLTEDIPKPLLKVGDKAIIDYNIDHLRNYGVKEYWISLRYLGKKIEKHIESNYNEDVNIKLLWEDKPLGTIGAISLISNFSHDNVLVMNSDLLTNLNYEDFFINHINTNADMSVATVPYNVNIPYAVLETSGNRVISFKEKPKYSYYSNGGIYLIKKKVLKNIPKNKFFDATDLMQNLIENKGHLISYPIRQYWLDIGRHLDLEKAQEDVKHINFS